jgi:hypothetical protein
MFFRTTRLGFGSCMYPRRLNFLSPRLTDSMVCPGA